MPVTVGVFVDPGQPGNRNAEYDAFDDAYAAFLLTEILPRVQDRYRITDDPDRWAIAGGSSGGSCAFTAAWMRPDRFRRVLSLLGSFAQSIAAIPTRICSDERRGSRCGYSCRRRRVIWPGMPRT